jgi:hypothetical protein
MAFDLFALEHSNIRGDCPKKRVKLRLLDSFRDGNDFWCFFLCEVCGFCLMQSKLEVRRCVSSGDEGDRRLRRRAQPEMCVKYNVIIWEKTAGCSNRVSMV